MAAPPPYNGQPPPGVYPPPPEGAYPPQTGGVYPPPPGGVYPPPAGVYSPPADYGKPTVVQPGQIIVQQAQPRPPDYFLLNLFTCLLCTCCAFPVCCVSIAGLFFAYKSQQAANGNRMEEAKSQGQLALKLAITAIVVGVIILTIWLILNFSVFQTARYHYTRYNYN